MGLIRSEAPEVLNFVITGQAACGASIIKDALVTHPMVVCHGDLLDRDNAVRRAHHESYFGPSGTTPDWLVDGHISGEQYITNKVFDNPLRGESVIGVTIDYSRMYAYDLWDYFEDWCRVGDFCLIQVKRNPVACFVSLQGCGYKDPWSTELDVTEATANSPLRVNVDSLVSFVRQQAAADEKVSRMCGDRLEIDYSEIVLDYHTVAGEVLSFLGLPGRRLRSPDSLPTLADDKGKFLSWHHLQDKVPSDVRKYFDPKDII